MKTKKGFKHYLLWTVNYTILGFVVLVSVGPLLWVVLSSFKSNTEILNNTLGLPKEWIFSGYLSVLKESNYLTYFFNSAFISLTATFLALACFTMAAYVLAKFEFPLKKTLFVLFSMTLLIPGHAKSQPIFMLVTRLGIYNTRTAIIFVYLSAGLAVSLFILKNVFMNIPKELDEAALIDSANFWQVFVRINLPLAKSGLSTAGILMFLGNWNEFYYALMLTSTDSVRTLPVAIRFFNDQFAFNYTRLFAALTLAMIPSIIVYLIAQEQVQKSIVSTGIKG